MDDNEKCLTIIRKQLSELELPRDALPYTPTFETLKADFERQVGSRLTNHAFWKLVSKTAKKGGLSTPGKKKRAPRTRLPTREEQLEVLRLVPDGIGSRDDLPYTRRFDDLYKRFTDLTGTRFTKHEFWRAVSSVAKQSRKPQPLFDAAPLGKLATDTVQFLERLNPWWRALPGPGTPDLRRWAYDEILQRFRTKIAPVIAMRGPRQVGKTTIQFQLIERLLRLRKLPPNQILRVQFDEAPALGSLKNPIEAIVRWFEDQILKQTLNEAAQEGKEVFFFFDEVQNLANWSEQIKAIVDSSRVQILVTGSSALRIGQGRDSLAGRLSSIELGPMRLTEIARLRGLVQLKPFSNVNEINRWTKKEFWLELIDHAKHNENALNQAFEVFSTYGGYPVCHKSASAQLSALATQIVEDVVERTVAHEQVKGASEEIVRGVFRLLCRYAGERVAIKRLSEELSARSGSGVSATQVNAAIDYLENTLLIRLLKPLEIGRKRHTSPPTICLCDHFMRYALLREEIPLAPWHLKGKNETLATQAGHLVEGIVGNLFASTQGVDAFFFPERKDEPEVDVVLSIGLKHLPIEVKYRTRLKTTDFVGVRSFCEKKHYDAPFGLVISQEQSGEVETGVIVIPAKAVLLLL